MHSLGLSNEFNSGIVERSLTSEFATGIHPWKHTDVRTLLPRERVVSVMNELLVHLFKHTAVRSLNKYSRHIVTVATTRAALCCYCS